MKERAAILVVHGGEGPFVDKWLGFCLDRLGAHTCGEEMRLFLWLGRPADPEASRLISEFPDAVVLRGGDEPLSHPHAAPLERLRRRAQDEGHTIIVTLDTDAHPVRSGWLAKLRSALESGASVAGIWREELASEIEPYVHPACLATTTGFLDRHGLRLDQFPESEGREDTASALTRAAQRSGERIVRLERSNRAQVHPLLAGVYGDLIYHHGAGSRGRILFWGDPPSRERERARRGARDATAETLFADPVAFVDWLRQGGRTPSHLDIDVDPEPALPRDLIHPRLFGRGSIWTSVRSALRTSRFVHITNALRPEIARSVHSALASSDAWRLHRDESPHFQCRHHNIYQRAAFPPVLSEVAEIFDAEGTKRWISDLAGVDATAPVTISASWYKPGDYSTPHRDVFRGRRVAFIWHLTDDWDPRWGGDLFWVPTGHAVPPRFNALTLFVVTGDNLHFVTPVSDIARGKRLAVSGWWCSSDVDAEPIPIAPIEGA